MSLLLLFIFQQNFKTARHRITDGFMCRQILKEQVKIRCRLGKGDLKFKTVTFTRTLIFVRRLLQKESSVLLQAQVYVYSFKYFLCDRPAMKNMRPLRLLRSYFINQNSTKQCLLSQPYSTYVFFIYCPLQGAGAIWWKNLLSLEIKVAEEKQTFPANFT